MKFNKWWWLLICAALPLAADRAAAANPSAAVTDADIAGVRVLDEPLIPLDGNSVQAENQALADALTSYASRAVPDDCSSLNNFAAAFPTSRWTGPLLVHLGAEYYRFGYYSKALDAWERAWDLCQTVRSGPAKAEADRALGELARMYSKIGRMTELGRLLDSTADRDLAGPATQLIHAAQDGLWMMRNRPGYCFRCGPLALDKILLRTAPGKTANPAFEEYQSPTNGFTLPQIGELAQRLGMDYQMAFRSPGAAVVLPAVVHWKVGHFAALVQGREGRLLVQDFTFHGGVWMTTNALDQESSGYFLIPAGPLAPGWRAVTPAEGELVRGRGNTSGSDPNATSPCDRKDGGGPCWRAKGMAAYSMHSLLVSLNLEDNPVGYTPPLGPMVQFTADYNELEANQPANFYYSNLGPKWTCNWISYITDNPSSPGADVTLYVDGGGTFEYNNFDPASQTYAPEVMSQSRLVKTSGSTYELQYGDGSRHEFTQSDGATGSTRRIFLTQIINSAGQALTLRYDAQLRITNVVDAIGQATTLQYTNAAYPFAITSVVDPFGRAANFQYNAAGLLVQITDVIGLTSQFTYGANQFISALVTPYGTTTFTAGTTNGVQSLKATNPEGQSELLVYSQSSGVPHSLPAAQVPHGLSTFNLFMDARDSFFWNHRAYEEAAWNYSRAKNLHWLHLSPNGIDSSRILESEKEPLESRIWYNYPGQSTNDGAPYYLDAAYSGTSDKPTVVARVLDDGSTQLRTYGYNAFGRITNSTDPCGRSFSYFYDTNGVDLLEMRMTRQGKNELLLKASYNRNHQQTTVTDAAGLTTAYGYNALGLIQYLTNANGAVTTFTYDPNGYMLAIDGPQAGTNDSVHFTYDAVGRMQTVTDTEGFTVAYAYDNLDRITQEAFPDGTYQQVVYDKLDPVAVRDRAGHWTTNTFNALRQLVAVQDHLGRLSQFKWCACGSISSMTDPLGRTTSWEYDLQSRPIAKTYPDGSSIVVAYEASNNRVHSRQDEAGQLRVLEYYPDDNLKRVAFPNALVPTPSVTYTYDPDYDRVLTMNDGAGATRYGYYPVTSPPRWGANQLASVSGPLPNSLVTYQYDDLNRVTNRNVAGVDFTLAFDILCRAAAVSNALGAFQFTYAGASARPATMTYPNGQSTHYSYYDNLGNERAHSILNLKPDGSLLSEFGFAYDANGLITGFTNAWDTLPTRVWSFAYDADNELTNAVQAAAGATLQTLSYVYDAAANRVWAASNGVPSVSTFNALNQLTGGGAGPANPATYEWDAEKRLTAVNLGTRRSEFSYDGNGHRVRIVEKTNGVVAGGNCYLWADSRICEVRDLTGSNTLRRLFAQGEQLVGTTSSNCFYTTDHINSVRELTDARGNVLARYDYDPFGQRGVLQESCPATLGFTGHFYHAPSGLHLALFRALDTANGRWLSRDPLGEGEGPNLYAYAGNSPPNTLDPYGLACPNEVSEDEFRMQVLLKQIELNESAAKWGPLAAQMAPLAAYATDGAYFGQNDITFRGEHMVGGNLNYYTQGQVWATYGASKADMLTAIYAWKAVRYGTKPAEVDIRMALEGYDCAQLVAKMELERHVKSNTPLPNGLTLTSLPPTYYTVRNDAVNSFVGWLGAKTGLW
jgi:RHS repeat-associated protein